MGRVPSPPSPLVNRMLAVFALGDVKDSCRLTSDSESLRRTADRPFRDTASIKKRAEMNRAEVWGQQERRRWHLGGESVNRGESRVSRLRNALARRRSVTIGQDEQRPGQPTISSPDPAGVAASSPATCAAFPAYALPSPLPAVSSCAGAWAG